MLRYLLCVLLSVAFCIQPSQAEAAESCVCPQMSLVDYIQEASLIFSGNVYLTNDQEEGLAISFYHVDGTKGLVSPQQLIFLKNEGAPECLVPFHDNQEYSVFAFGTDETGYYTTYCAMKMAASVPDFIKTIRKIRTEQWALYTQTHQPPMHSFKTEIESKRFEASGHLDFYNSEQALRLYAYTAALSENAVIDLLGQMEAALQLNMAALALERADDVLEKEAQNAQAWGGRYRALAQLGRWNELPEKANLSGLIYRRAVIDADLKSVNLNAAVWVFVNAAGRNFTGTNFSRSHLTDVDFTQAQLQNTDFSGAQLSYVVLNGVDLTGAQLDGATFSHITFDAKTVWPVGFDKARLNP